MKVSYVHKLWQLCEKAWGTLQIEHDKKSAVDHGGHPKHGRVLSLTQDREKGRQMFVLHHELEGVIVFCDPGKYGRGRSDIIDGCKVDKILAYLKKYTGAA